MDELQRALREHGIASCHDVALAVLEVDGSISCLKYDEIKPDASITWRSEKSCKNTSSLFAEDQRYGWS